MSGPVKALTLWQPWASLIALGVKTIETRSWSTAYRGPLAIHAGMDPAHCFTAEGGELIRSNFPGSGPFQEIDVTMLGDDDQVVARLPLGAVVATAGLVGCVPIDQYEDTFDLDFVFRGSDGRLLLSTHRGPEDFGSDETDITEQLPYGDFTPGRFAWLLDDIVPLDPPVPARGRQGLWNWEPSVVSS